jgi:hypothetical protein
VPFIALQQRNAMKRLGPAILMALGPCLAAAAPQPIGQYGRWGAFRTADGASCYAIARPERSGRRDKAYLTISAWPARRLFRQVHVRFRERGVEEAALSVGGRRFPLITAAMDGWPASPAEGQQIARLLREGGLARITARINRRRTSDVYMLAGVASAIDAADLACLRGR